MRFENRRSRMRAVAFMLCVLGMLTACSEVRSTSRAELDVQEVGCPPLSVTVDGKPFNGFASRYAFTKKGRRLSALIIRWSDAPGVSCDKVMEPDFAEGEEETYVSAGFGMVGFRNALVNAELNPIRVEPAKAGDAVSVCIPETKILPESGPYKGKVVVVKGMLESPWCGAKGSAAVPSTD